MLREGKDEEMQSVSVKPIVSEPESWMGYRTIKIKYATSRGLVCINEETTNDARHDPFSVEPASAPAHTYDNGLVVAKHVCLTVNRNAQIA